MCPTKVPNLTVKHVLTICRRGPRRHESPLVGCLELGLVNMSVATAAGKKFPFLPLLFCFPPLPAHPNPHPCWSHGHGPIRPCFPSRCHFNYVLVPLQKPDCCLARPGIHAHIPAGAGAASLRCCSTGRLYISDASPACADGMRTRFRDKEKACGSCQ